MSTVNLIRIAVIGVGNMGTVTASFIYRNEIEGAVLCAVCDIDKERLEFAMKQWQGIEVFEDYKELIDSDNKPDAIYISTPHYMHPEIAIYAMERGVAVITEKPEAVETRDARLMNETAQRTGTKFGIMFNQRTNPVYKRLRDMVKSGELGSLKRVVWNITNWYRTQEYFNSGTWRATWKGEGGGVLINQSVHNLDLWQWIFGMPKRIRAFCKEGSTHDIEVEDDATIFAEYDNGATALFITSTGEFPGVNRLEASFTKARVVIEGGRMSIVRFEDSDDFIRTTTQAFATPTITQPLSYVEVDGDETAHKGIMRNFTNHLLYGDELIAPGCDGIYSLALCNASLLSTWTDDWVDMTHSGNFEDLYNQYMSRKRANSKLRDIKPHFLDLEAGAGGGSLGSK